MSVREPAQGPRRIAMWSGPRNLSTAMMRSWENRADCEVMDEPLYAAFLARTGLDHPSAAEIIEAGPASYDDAVAACLAAPTGGSAISYQKHMAHHLALDADVSWLDEFTSCLLLRDPRRVLASYTKVYEDVSLELIGLPQQLALVDRCVMVIDSDDFLADPEHGLRLICDRADVRYDPAMLAWPSGPRPTDGVWAKHWYHSVEASTSFGPPPSSAPPEVPEHLRTIAAEAVELHAELSKHCVRI